jgi:ABC-type nitrate/sulfonate/bicarbonate transport system substrate-binding protein
MLSATEWSVEQLRLVITIAFVLFAMPCSRTESEAAEELMRSEKVRVAYVSSAANFAPLWVAVEKNFFKEHGITVDPIFTRTASGVQALLSGDVQFIYSVVLR